MSIAAVPSTTLSAELSASERRFSVASTTGISVGYLLAVGRELMVVQAIPVSGTLEVRRGAHGTQARIHASGKSVFYGAASVFDVTQLGGEHIGLAGDPGVLPPYILGLGARRRDSLGNEYVLCDFGSTLYSRQPVAISDAYVASALSTTGRGRVGVVAEPNGGTSDQWGWVQIYGRCLMQIGMSGVSPSDAANGPTTLSTSAQTRFMLATSLTTPAAIGWTSQTSTEQYRVLGIAVATDASPGDVSAVTSAASHTGSQIAVFLNYPQISYQRGDS